MAGWEGAINGWGIATGTNSVIHTGCGLSISDAHPQYPTEAFSWVSDTFAAWSNNCSTNAKVYAVSYSLTSSPGGIQNAFVVTGGGPSATIISNPSEVFPCELWSSHPQGIPYLMDFSSGVDGGNPVIPSPSAYSAKPQYMDFTVTITATFPPNSCPGTLSKSFEMRIHTNWSPRASDLIVGFDSNKYDSVGESGGQGPTYFHPTTGEVMSGEEWRQYVCSTAGGTSRFLTGTAHNMF